MEKSLIGVTLTVFYKNMKTPKEKSHKFEETLKAGYWKQIEHAEEVKDERHSETMFTAWSRDFKPNKKPQQIIKSTRNLLLRAAEYGGILDFEAEITIGENSPEPFAYHSDQPSDYFKTKTWK